MCDKKVLNGIWDFFYSGLEEPEFPLDFSEVMPVPGCFDLMEPYCGKRGYAVYRCFVHTAGKVRLFIDGLGISARILWDRKCIGECKYAYMPEEFIFDAGDEGRHELVIVIDNRYNEAFHPNFDFYGYGGIYGDVFIERISVDSITEVLISTEDYTTGTVRVRAEAANGYSGPVSLSFDSGAETVCRFEQGKLDCRLEVPGFRLWNTDVPNLHQLTLRTATDERTEIFGIRKFHTEGRRIFLNGKPLKLFGYNRHESHPAFGAASPVQQMAIDLRLLKDQGGNFIRGSHYPQRRSFLELCDRMGILVWEETLGWGNKPPELHSPEFLASQREQAEKMTRAGFNHPCIMFRGFLNENDCTLEETRSVIQALYDGIRAIDEHCLISFSSNKYEKDVCTDLVDVVSMNPYPGWYDSSFDNISTVDRVQTRLRKLSDALPKDKPFLITEIGCEALYGFRDPLKTRWTEEYQAQVLTEVCDYVFSGDDCAGVAIWQFTDTRSYVNGPGIYARARGFNNKGVLDEYRRPKLAWYALKQFLTEKSKTTTNSGEIRL